MGRTLTSFKPSIRYHPAICLGRLRPSIYFGQQRDNKNGQIAVRTSLQPHRRFSAIHHLLQHSAPKTYFSISPQSNKKRSRVFFKCIRIFCKIIWNLVAAYCISLILLIFFPFPADFRYRIFKSFHGTQFADWGDFSILGIAWKKQPDFVFTHWKTPNPFVVVRKEEMLRPSSAVLETLSTPETFPSDVASRKVCVLTLRSVTWLRIPGGRGARGDPYERLSKRGSWGVVIETPEGRKKFCTPMVRRPQDRLGDLVIEVEMEPLISGPVDAYLKQLREGELVLVVGPRREEKVFELPR